MRKRSMTSRRIRGVRRSVPALAICGMLFSAWPGGLEEVAAQVGNGHTTGSPLDRIAGLTIANEHLEEALRQLQRSSGVPVAYSPDLIPAEMVVTCDCAPLTVREALTRLLRDTNLMYSATRSQVRIAPRPQQRQQVAVGTVMGSVVNATDGTPVVNAMVQLDGRGVLTNENGRFILVNMPPGAYELTVTGLGWDPETVSDVNVVAGETTTVDVQVTRRVIPLSAVVVSPGTFGVLDEISAFTPRSMTREQIETVPQLGEDVFRAVRRLPGVASDDISTRLTIRGGSDREVLFLLDGMELYDPYHLKDFEGALGIVDVHAVGGIDLHTGGFPVDYGNRLAGVFAMETRNPPVEGTRTTLGLSLTNASVLSQGGFAGGRGQWLFSARRGYMDIVLALTDANDDISPQYYDLFGKVQYQLGSRHLVSGHFLAARDHLRLNLDEGPSERGDLGTRYGNSYGWVTWKAFFKPWLSARTILSAGQGTHRRHGDLIDLGNLDSAEALFVSDVASFDLLGLKHEWTVDFSDRAALRAGFDLKRLSSDYDYLHWTRNLLVDRRGEIVPDTDTTSVALAPTATEVGTFVAARVRPVPRITAEVGVRYDSHSHTEASELSPRAHTVIELDEQLTLRASVGRYVQSQGVHELEVADGEETFARRERSDQVAVGIEYRRESGLVGRLEAYARKIEDPRRQYVNLWRELLAFPETEPDRFYLVPTEARTRGIELLLNKDGRTWDWTASYALAIAEDRLDEGWVPRWLDQRHTVVLSVGYHPSPNWFVTAAWQAHSGWPFTPQEVTVDTATAFRSGDNHWPWVWREAFGSTNSARLPAYHRLDLRLTRRFTVRGGRLDVYLDLFNAYDQQNLRSYDYWLQQRDQQFWLVRVPDEELLPILPSIGVRWEF